MQQVALVQSGCQQWIRQPAAIHGDQFAFSSSLAIFVHASDTYKLRKLLAQQTQHINALCWSPVDANLLATSNAEKVIRVYSLEAEAAVYSRFLYSADGVSSLRWATHDEGTLLAAAGSAVAAWPFKITAEWKPLHSFKATITCMQQSATETRLLAVGCADASLHLFDMLLQKVVCTVKLEDAAAVPCDVQFDPLSKAYLLLLCSNGAVSLYGVGEGGASLDLVSCMTSLCCTAKSFSTSTVEVGRFCNSLPQVTSLAKQPAARRTAAFVPNAPGNFAVISDKSGILQVWNVSQQQPLHSLRVGSGPAQSLSFFPGSSRALITFQDGTVMVYDVSAQQQLWCTQPGHTETIFDCCWARDATSQQSLATCSFDGSVRVWNAASHTCVKTLDTRAPGRDEKIECVKGVPSNALYSVCWSPDCSLLAASSAGGAVYLFDYAKGIVVKKLQLHSKPCLKVAWHPTKPTLLASSSLDGSVVVFKTDGSKVKVLQQSSGASCCAWARDDYLLATTSEAGTVYVYDLDAPEGDCVLRALVGHAQRSFSVAWSPLLPHLLLSGGDDATARVWDTRKGGSCIALLAGHRTEVRALSWHPELPWMVLTGSWDATIRVWDWRTQSTVYMCTQHHSDIYGLAMHSSYPWLLASASRDSTLRFWDARGLAAGTLTRAFLEGGLPRGQADAYAEHSTPVMCGPASQQLSDWMQSHIPRDAAGALLRPAAMPAAACIELFSRLSALFMTPGSTQQLWQLTAAVAAHLSTDACASPSQARLAASTAAGAADALLTRSASGPAARLSTATSLGKLAASGLSSECRTSSIGGGSGGCSGTGCLCHLAKVRAGLVSAANQLELSVRGRGVGRACMGAAKREELLQQAALMHLEAGDAERCCELLVELGLWDRALSLAPAVSHTYWRQLMQRATDAMAKAGAASKELLPYMLAAGQVTPAVELLMRQKQHEQAASIAAVAAYGCYAKFAGDECSSGRSLAAGSPPPGSGSGSLLSPSGSGALLLSAALPLHHSASGPALAQLSLTYKQQPQQQQHQQLPLTGALLPKRNSLPPLRCTPGVACEPVVSPNSAPAAAAAACADGGDPAGLQLSSLRLTPLGPASRSVSGSGLSTVTQPSVAGCGTSGPAASTTQPSAVSPTEGRVAFATQQSGRLQPRPSFGHGLGPAADSHAAAEACLRLESVCKTQVELYRSQGQPIKAACAALMVHDVPAAVTALHLGHEPELAGMLSIALAGTVAAPAASAGGAGGATVSQQSLVDRVFEALAIKCEAAGDWWAAALALGQLSRQADVQHQQQLLAVREEKASHEESTPAASNTSSSNGVAGVGRGRIGVTPPSLRQQLQLPSATHYAGLAKSTADAVDCVRYLLLARQHGHAAAKAINSMQPVLADMQRLVVMQTAAGLSSTSNMGSHQTSAPVTQQQQRTSLLLSSAPVVELLRWHSCLESLDKAELPLSCWHDVFAHLLLTGALRAFSYAYQQVGSFLLSRLRHWVEEHQLQSYPLSRAVLLLLEAQLVLEPSPEAASCLLHAVLKCSNVAADVRAAADSALQALALHPSAAPQPQATTTATTVVVSNSSLPHRPPPMTVKRSAVSGQLLSCGPWAFADDGCSVLSLDEAVMLSHVMRVGPYGTGLVLQLLV